MFVYPILNEFKINANANENLISVHMLPLTSHTFKSSAI